MATLPPPSAAAAPYASSSSFSSASSPLSLTADPASPAAAAAWSPFSPAPPHSSSPSLPSKSISLVAASSLPLLPPEVSSSRAEEVKAAALRHERVGNRAFQAMRPVYMHTRFAASSGAAGSAYVSLGKTKITCAVYGPRPSLLSATSECGKVNVDIRFSPFAGADEEAAAFDRNKAGGSTDEGLLTTALQQALETVLLLSRYPKAFIDVYLLILEDAGGVLSAALTCAGLAVADAGLEMLDVLTGASACGFTLVDPSSTRRRVFTLLDPEPEEKSAVDGDDLTVVDVAFCPGISSVCFAHARGPLLSSAGFAQQLFGLCEAACEALAEEVRDCLRNSFTSRQRLSLGHPQQSGSAEQQEKHQSDSDAHAKTAQV